ncbi:flagellar basal body rod protein FlgB [Mariluticola halotolerans]|uniref:flagellar basal body rod protein FlgB n=1 Tax=Mariluticola halotolerans TaxID=2909283 RepID=UPI0026E29D8F|nr:flagellar basal body rod protein FlgB [Mariluticola halotolerans]UJQ95409.1 flagellar basal body rod protein FlgB [Mariluticola halotolerans]
MGISQIPLFAAITQKMQWHQTRQGLLAENVANAETPNYRGRDLKEYNFAEHVGQFSTAQVTTAATQKGHYAIASSDTNGFAPQKMNSFEITPEGNGVTLEDEMMKVSANQMDFQAATTLYTRSIRLMRTALGR